MKILIIQTAFLGDVILATPLIEALHEQDPSHEIHFACRRGNQSLLTDHPKISKLWVWDKSQKYKDIYRLIRAFRREKYDVVYNVQRFFNSGMMAVLAGAKTVIGFDKNPWSRFYTHALPHVIQSTEIREHEVDRNLSLLMNSEQKRVRPKLYPSESDFEKVQEAKNYITISPASVWYTKQYPQERWLRLMDNTDPDVRIYLLGGPGDVNLAERLKSQSLHPDVKIVAGELSLLQSAALMRDAMMNYTNDSAPTHMASAMNARVTMMYCSTVPAFGFWPLSEDATILEIQKKLECRPCGLHGHAECPIGTFECSHYSISSENRTVISQ